MPRPQALRGEIATTLSLVLAVIGGLLFLVSPLARPGETPVGPGHRAPDAPAAATSVIEEVGVVPAVGLAVFPALVAAIPVLGRQSAGVRGLRILAASVLTLYVAVALPFGLFFAPSAVAMLLASLVRRSPPPPRLDPAGNGGPGRHGSRAGG